MIQSSENLQTRLEIPIVIRKCAEYFWQQIIWTQKIVTSESFSKDFGRIAQHDQKLEILIY